MPAAPTLEEVRLGSGLRRHLVVVDGLFRQFLSQLFHLVARHLDGRHRRKLPSRYHSNQDVLAQSRVLQVLLQAQN